MRRLPALASLVALALAVTGAPAAVPAARAAAPSPVVSQVYGGGGNARATYAQDYVELFNPGDAAGLARRLVRPVRERDRDGGLRRHERPADRAA